MANSDTVTNSNVQNQDNSENDVFKGEGTSNSDKKSDVPESLRNRKQAIVLEIHPSEADSGVEEGESPGTTGNPVPPELLVTDTRTSNPEVMVGEMTITGTTGNHEPPTAIFIEKSNPEIIVEEIESENESRKTSASESDTHKTSTSAKKSRKVSVEPGNHPEMEKSSWHYGRRGSPDFGRHLDPVHGIPRKISSDYFGHPHGRRSIDDAFYCQPHHHQRISVISVMTHGSNASDKTFRDPSEVLPDADYYRDYTGTLPTYEYRQRPTLEQLRHDRKSDPPSPTSVTEDLLADELQDDKDEESGLRKPTSSALKFGWIQGVLVRCLLNIFGVMLFLRLTWVTGQAGIGLATVVVLLSAFVTTITTMSMSAICTNGEVEGGGAYYMISRSLGPEFGGSIGVVFALANAIAAAMYVVGFAETVRDLMWEYGAVITGDSLHEVRIFGCATSVLLIGIVLIGMEWEAKAQLGLLVILLAAIVNFFIGTFIPPSDEDKVKGVVGYQYEVFTKNLVPDFRGEENFFSVFSIFFPAATGILAGANISGDLKNPQSAIPKGTFLAILLTTIVYIAMLWSAGACILRDAVGPALLVTGNIAAGNASGINTTQTVPQSYLPLTLSRISDCGPFNNTCDYGLLNDNGVVGIASAFRPLILAGIFSATLSSALASLVGAPKVFQALGKDKLFPYLEFFSKGYGVSGEPRRGYVLAFGICVGMTCIGALDLIAPIISNFFLMAYALINFSCFRASVANTPGFRPAFKYYNHWISLLGSLACVAVMFLINWWAALVTFVVVSALYTYIRTKGPEVNWGSSAQAHAYREALTTTLSLVNVEEHVKNFRPQILVMSGYPRNRPALMEFVSSITKKQSLLISGHIFKGLMSEHVQNLRSNAAYKWMKNRNIKAFYNSVVAPTFRIGSQVLMQALGVGKLRPNTLIVGYKSDWHKADPVEVDDYFNTIQDAFDLKFAVGILRVPEGFDVNRVPDELVNEDDETDDEDESDVESADDEESMSREDKTNGGIILNTPDNSSVQKPQNIGLKRLNTVDEGLENKAFEEETNVDDNTAKQPLRHALSVLSTQSASSFKSSKLFHDRQSGNIDVWWLFDDGGLTLLIPYILSTRKKWKDCRLRVFCAGTKKGNVKEDEDRMASLLKKFRIKYTELTVIPDLRKKPSLTTYREFESVIRRWRLRSGEYPDIHPWKISDSDLVTHKLKTYRNLRLREQLQIHSSDSTLIVMTLPIPSKIACPAGLYMGWLEALTRDMPPMLLLRGNQQSVLTYYS